MRNTQEMGRLSSHARSAHSSSFVSAQKAGSAEKSDEVALNTSSLSERAKRYARRTQGEPVVVSAVSTKTAVHSYTEPGTSSSHSPSMRSHPLALNDTVNGKENIDPLRNMNDDQGVEKAKQAACSSLAITQTQEAQIEDSPGVAPANVQTQKVGPDVECRGIFVIGDEDTLAVPSSQPLKPVTLRPVSFWGDVKHGLPDEDDSDTEEEYDFTFETLDWVTKRMEPVKFWGARGQLSDYMFPVPCPSDDDSAAENTEALCIDEEKL